MGENSTEKAKTLFFRYRGNFFYMSREGEYEEYKRYNISKEQELLWKDELVETLYNQLSFEDSYAFHTLAMIAENYHDYSIIEKLIVYSKDNMSKGDSLIKLVYAELLLNIACPKALTKVKLDVVSNLLRSVSDNPIVVDSSWSKKGFADKLPDEAYIKDRLERDLNRLAEAKSYI
jgi:hypothetical protein